MNDNYEVLSMEWEYEDKLPQNLTDIEYCLMHHYSAVLDGVRMFPFVTIYKLDGSSYRIYLGA